MKTLYLKKAFTSLLFFLLLFLSSNELFSQKVNKNVAFEKEELFKISIVGASFIQFKIDTTLQMIQRMDIHYLCVKNVHLPFNSSDSQIEAFHAKLKEARIKPVSVGLIYMKTKAEVDNAFEYAKRVGVKLIIGTPNHELLPYVEQKVKEYDIQLAIHIHGYDIPLYPDVADVIKHIKNLDSRIGVCLDIGHDIRAGANPIEDLKKYDKRILDIHIKNVTAADKTGRTCEMGRGVINIVEFVKMLRKVKYAGACTLEFEKDPKDPLPGMAESVGYLRGVIAATKK